jgi:23S rRNA pseudouridine1911/1915/1917 synthase
VEPGDDDDDDDGDATEHRFVVDLAAGGQRLDAIVAATLAATLSRAQAQRLIEDGHVTVAGAVVPKPAHRARAGVEVVVRVPAPVTIELVPEAIPLVILHEDAEVIVIDKPAGLVVHPAPGHPRGTLVNALLHHVRDFGGIGGELRPGIVHRLDKGTSGVMVVAKTAHAHRHLAAAFAAKSAGQDAPLTREYLGIAAPPPPATSGTLRTMHGRHPTDRRKFTSRCATGKPAITAYTVEQRLADAALIRFRLQTGRTHQIRVHAADHGWPLLGDPLYGKAPRALAPLAEALGHQALHAAHLAFTHPTTAELLSFHVPPPADFSAALAALTTRSST